MTHIERLSLQLTEEQREYFLMLIAANPDTPVFDLFLEVVNHKEP